MLCYCSSERTYADCCQPVIQNTSACTPEQLMRSRFSAYSLKNYDYILNTYAPEQRKSLSKKELRNAAENTTWLSLDVINTNMNETSGTVEFVATYQSEGEYFTMHELSSFIKQHGRWYYTTGIMKEKTGQIYPNRNAECPCGSGKKFKKCCQ